jgi:hypothetical protein
MFRSFDRSWRLPLYGQHLAVVALHVKGAVFVQTAVRIPITVNSRMEDEEFRLR